MLLLALTLAAPAVTPPPVVEPGVRLGPITLGTPACPGRHRPAPAAPWGRGA
ncbi:MAG: hypothetical protein R3F43_14405 [bacterium]